jgi:hypothetical protein
LWSLLPEEDVWSLLACVALAIREPAIFGPSSRSIGYVAMRLLLVFAWCADMGLASRMIFVKEQGRFGRLG